MPGRRRLARGRTIGHPFGPHREAAAADRPAPGGGSGTPVVGAFASWSTWTLPAARAKNGKAHSCIWPSRRARSSPACRALSGQDLVFSTGTTAPSGFSKAKLTLDTAIANEPGAEMRICGLALPRLPPNGRDLAGRCGLPAARRRPAAEPCQRQHPRRRGCLSARRILGERKAALEAWAVHVVRCGDDCMPADNVVPLGKNGMTGANQGRRFSPKPPPSYGAASAMMPPPVSRRRSEGTHQGSRSSAAQHGGFGRMRRPGKRRTSALRAFLRNGPRKSLPGQNMVHSARAMGNGRSDFARRHH